jgi:hypothetical protein
MQAIAHFQGDYCKFDRSISFANELLLSMTQSQCFLFVPLDASGHMNFGVREMLGRLGNVLYWLGCITAGLTMAVGGFMVYADGGRSEDIFMLIVFGLIALAVWLLGRACRYVLAGT